VFSQPTKLAQANVPPHKIQTNQDTPLYYCPYRSSQLEQEEIDKQVKTLLDKACIQPSSSPWTALVVLAKKKNGTWCFVLIIVT
jgi:hypothetical protein